MYASMGVVDAWEFEMMQLTRRAFCCQTAACLTHFAFADALGTTKGYPLVARTDRARIIAAATRYLDMRPRTITRPFSGSRRFS